MQCPTRRAEPRGYLQARLLEEGKIALPGRLHEPTAMSGLRARNRKSWMSPIFGLSDHAAGRVPTYLRGRLAVAPRWSLGCLRSQPQTILWTGLVSCRHER